MSLYNSYDDFYSKNPSPSQLGGRNRASKAIRDRLGRFIPNDEFLRDMWSLDDTHGRAGGIARAKSAPRDNRGRFKRSN